MLTILNYNENKVKDGKAKCILENGFGCDLERLTIDNKVKGFENYLNRNRRAKVKAVHISLNFHPAEKLSERKLQEIAFEYMDRIGFADQPYLVYQHSDAGHPHMHIVTTNIQSDGSRIIMYNRGRNQSEAARKAIENKFHLVKATHKTSTQEADFRKIQYGATDTKRGISNVVREVVRTYRFTSLPELNAALKQFNVLADRGTDSSRMFQSKGLHYRILDNEGNKIGVPIKASSITGKPTLALIEKQFKNNDVLRQPHKERLVKAIESAFVKKGRLTKSEFVSAMKDENVYTLFRVNDEGRVYGITFVDNKTKSVFNGNDLGKKYGAKGLMDRLNAPDKASSLKELIGGNVTISDPASKESLFGGVVSDLTDAKQFDFSTPEGAMKLRKRRKKRNYKI